MSCAEIALLVMSIGLRAVTLMLPPAYMPVWLALIRAPPIDNGPLLFTQVLPVVDCPSIWPTSVVIGLLLAPILLVANSSVLPPLPLTPRTFSGLTLLLRM